MTINRGGEQDKIFNGRRSSAVCRPLACIRRSRPEQFFLQHVKAEIFLGDSNAFFLYPSPVATRFSEFCVVYLEMYINDRNSNFDPVLATERHCARMFTLSQLIEAAHFINGMRTRDALTVNVDAGCYLGSVAGIVNFIFNTKNDDDRFLGHWNFHPLPALRLLRFYGFVSNAYQDHIVALQDASHRERRKEEAFLDISLDVQGRPWRYSCNPKY